MSEVEFFEVRPNDSVAVPGAFAGSPYQFKAVDPHSSHSLILSLMPPVGNGRILDVGAAHGYLSAVLKERGFQVTAIEANPVLAQEAAHYCDEVHVADLDGPLPPLAGKFDFILYGDVLEHLKNPMDVLTNLDRSLAPEGRVILSLPNIANIWVRLQLLVGRFDYQGRGILDRTHLRFFTRKTFLRFLDEAGLEAEHLTATPIPLPLVVSKRFHGRLFSAAHDLNAWIARHWSTMFGYQFVAVARKRNSFET